MEDTVNERLKILMQALNLNIASFASALGVKDSTIRNYFEAGRQSKPGYDFFERLNRSFGTVNFHWLFGGGGAPLSNMLEESRAVYQIAKKNTGNVAGINTGSMTHQAGDVNLKRELEIAQETITLLRSQLVDKERLIRVYETTPTSPK